MGMWYSCDSCERQMRISGSLHQLGPPCDCGGRFRQGLRGKRIKKGIDWERILFAVFVASVVGALIAGEVLKIIILTEGG